MHQAITAAHTALVQEVLCQVMQCGVAVELVCKMVEVEVFLQLGGEARISKMQGRLENMLTSARIVHQQTTEFFTHFKELAVGAGGAEVHQVLMLSTEASLAVAAVVSMVLPVPLQAKAVTALS